MVSDPKFYPPRIYGIHLEFMESTFKQDSTKSEWCVPYFFFRNSGDLFFWWPFFLQKKYLPFPLLFLLLSLNFFICLVFQLWLFFFFLVEQPKELLITIWILFWSLRILLAIWCSFISSNKFINNLYIE